MDKQQLLKLKAQQYYQENKNIIKEKNKKYREDNKEVLKLKAQQYYQNNKDKILAKNKKYRKENLDKIKKKIRENRKNKKWKKSYEDLELEKIMKIKNKYESFLKYVNNKNNINYHLAHNIRNRIRIALKNSGTNKSEKSTKLLGCSISKLKIHIEKQFKPGMYWNNHGEWHIDHIIPCCKFDLTQEEDQKKCFHYTNLQPLWAKENLSKGTKQSQNLNS